MIPANQSTIGNVARSRRPESGQTIIVAMIILGLLLIFGFVFIGIVNRNIQTSNRQQNRSVANDLSEAGIRYAHAQLLRSELGADWRGPQTAPAQGTSPDTTFDPDAFWLRPAAQTSGGARLPFIAGGNQVDLGGPDGLGPYFRVEFNNGRALVRVRYSQSDANLFQTSPLGPLRNPGLARNYLIIESVGREGRINVLDPTTLASKTERRIQNYPSANAFQQELAAFRQGEARFASVPVARAFASIGIIESARFITNTFRNSRPVELGVDPQLGATYRASTTGGVGSGVSVADKLRIRVGTSLPLIAPATGAVTGAFPGFGGMYINGDLKLFGKTEVNLNQSLGDQISVAGSIAADDPGAQLILNVTKLQANGTWASATSNLASNTFSSASSSFQTGGVLRDGMQELDSDNRPRGIGYKTPPSMLTRDPQTGATRYVSMTRDSGAQVGNGNSGRYGYGRGVYVDNDSQRQTPADSTTGTAAGGETSLINEWLNPGGNAASTGWRGWIYSPPGAYLELLSDGFTIQRDGSGDASQWRYPNGAVTGTNTIRYRLGRGSDGELHIVNTFTFGNPTKIDTNLSSADFSEGPQFNNVLYFGGNVRVRGVIPTDIQLSVVSNATVYIEGSITKGVTGTQYTASATSGAIAVGQRLTRPSRSLLLIAAKDYVAVNTTQFFGGWRGQAMTPKEDVSSNGAYNPFVMKASDPNGLRLVSDFVLDPQGASANPNNPSTWRPFALDYTVPGAPASRLNTNLLLSHTMDNGAAAASFVTLDINSDFGGSSYLFPETNTGFTPPYRNLASEYITGANIPVYGLGSENFQRYSQFESIAFPIVSPANTTVDVSTNSFVSTAVFGSYRMTQQGLNDLRLRPTSLGGLPTNDYLLGRLAFAPHDVRIEATIYAEQGSFFVIPGPWFNPNPNDTFDRWDRPDDAGGGSLTSDEKNQRRFEELGSFPATPFYGEPLDVRVQVIGAISENMPVPLSVQSEWMRKWGWIPQYQGATSISIPESHTRGTTLSAGLNVLPNFNVSYDPVLATGRLNGFANSSDPNDSNSPTLRVDDYGRPLPPLPRLPVSPTLAYFGEVR